MAADFSKYYDANADKLKARTRTYYAANTERVKAREASRRATPGWRQVMFRADLKKTYGIDFLTYSALLICQSGRCAACSEPMLVPNVDHDKVDNKVRGLLCGSCNRALGHAKDSVPRLAACISYLEKFNG